MRMQVGRSANEVEFFDDAGNKVDIPCQEVKMHLKPNEATTIDLLGVYMDEIDAVVHDDKAILSPVRGAKPGP